MCYYYFYPPCYVLFFIPTQYYFILHSSNLSGDALQAEDRVRRIGQTKEVTSIWMRAFDIDTQIDEIIEKKKQNSHAVVDGTSSNNNNHQSSK
jgi:hypothetical protein